jgi:hypothetical protein
MLRHQGTRGAGKQDASHVIGRGRGDGWYPTHCAHLSLPIISRRSVRSSKSSSIEVYDGQMMYAREMTAELKLAGKFQLAPLKVLGALWLAG